MTLGAVRLRTLLTVAQDAAPKTLQDLCADLMRDEKESRKILNGTLYTFQISLLKSDPYLLLIHQHTIYSRWEMKYGLRSQWTILVRLAFFCSTKKVYTDKRFPLWYQYIVITVPQIVCSHFFTRQLWHCAVPWMHTCMVLLSSDSSSAVASSAALVSVNESRYTIILAAAGEREWCFWVWRTLCVWQSKPY